MMKENCHIDYFSTLMFSRDLSVKILRSLSEMEYSKLLRNIFNVMVALVFVTKEVASICPKMLSQCKLEKPFLESLKPEQDWNKIAHVKWNSVGVFFDSNSFMKIMGISEREECLSFMAEEVTKENKIPINIVSVMNSTNVASNMTSMLELDPETKIAISHVQGLGQLSNQTSFMITLLTELKEDYCLVYCCYIDEDLKETTRSLQVMVADKSGLSDVPPIEKMEEILQKFQLSKADFLRHETLNSPCK